MLNKDNYCLILSNEIKNVIKNIDHPISQKFLFLDKNKDYGFPISYIDIIDDNMISYTPAKKIIEIRKNNLKPEPLIWQTSRNEHRIGRFISKFLGESDANLIESFINKYKAEIKSLNNFDNFDIVEGDSISKYYNHNSYSKGSGPLNKSCMRHDSCNEFFEFYSINNEKVKMVVLFEDSKKEKILGRALLWYVDDPKIIILDRIYTTNDSDVNLFIKFANKNGWYYKKSQKFDEPNFTNKNSTDEKINCKIYLKNSKFRYFPYLDTFYYFDNKNNYITNDYNEYKNNKYTIKLRATDGREQGNENFVFDIYNNDYIKTQDSVYCEIGGNRIFKKDIIYIDRRTSSPDYIRYSKYDNKLYSKNNTEWSDTLQSFINKEKSFLVFFDDKKESYDYIHSDFKGELFEYVKNKDDFYHIDLIIKHYDNFYLKSEYDEEKIKKDMESQDKFKKAKDLNNFFDEFIVKIGNGMGKDYSKQHKWSDF